MKRALLVSVLCSFACLFSGCGSSTSSSGGGGTPPTPPPQPVSAVAFVTADAVTATYPAMSYVHVAQLDHFDQFTSVGGDLYDSVTLSADGKQILYEHPTSPGSKRGIYVMNSNGFGETLLTHDNYDNFNPQFSANGKKIVYNSHATHLYSPSIVVMNADGTGGKEISLDQRVYPAVAAGMWAPALSPDGSKIAVGGWNAAYDIHGGIFVMDADGSNQSMLTNPGATGSGCLCSDGMPAFSADGTKIAFSRSYGTGVQDIFIIGTNGSNLTKLTDSQGANWDPVFVGGKILFVSNRDDTTRGSNGYDLYSINPDGSNLTRLTNDSVYTAFTMGGFQF